MTSNSREKRMASVTERIMTTSVDAAQDDILLWVDVETTGLTPATSELLQVAAIVTDLQGTPLADPFMEVVQHHNSDELRAKSVPLVQDMHDATGLWDRLATGLPMAAVDATLYGYVSNHAAGMKKARLAGNSVRLDLNFLEAFLPVTYNYLHYRSVDVSALAYTLVEWGFVPSYYEKKKTHDALDDIQESLAEFLFLKDHLSALH